MEHNIIASGTIWISQGKCSLVGAGVDLMDFTADRVVLYFCVPDGMTARASATPQAGASAAPLNSTSGVSIEHGNVGDGIASLTLRWYERGNGAQVDLGAANVGGDVIVYGVKDTVRLP